MGELSEDDVFMKLSSGGESEEVEVPPEEDVTASEIEQEQPAQRRRLSAAEKWYEEFKAPLLAGTILEQIQEPERRKIVKNIFVNSDVAGLVARIANARTQAHCQIAEGRCSNATIAMITARGSSEDVKVALELMQAEEARLIEAMTAKGPVKERRFTAGQVQTWIKREKIASMLRYKKEVSKICKELDCCDQTVYNVKKRLENNESLAPKPICGRPSKRDKEFLSILCSMYGSDPFMSYRKAAENLGVDKTTIGRAISQLGMKSFVRRIRCMVSANGKQKRLER